MECNFTVGQKVVCINDEPLDEHAPVGVMIRGTTLDGLTKGKTYTIRSVFFCEVWRCVLLRLEEISREGSRFRGKWYESGFDPRRFRPVIQRKTDISIFKAMLNPSKEQVPA